MSENWFKDENIMLFIGDPVIFIFSAADSYRSGPLLLGLYDVAQSRVENFENLSVIE